MGRLDREDYVHPVTHGAEPPSRWLVVWPFRFVIAVAVLAILVGVYFVITHLHITGAGNSQG